jgi:nucleotide-binding universal stress UspA family protein
MPRRVGLRSQRRRPQRPRDRGCDGLGLERRGISGNAGIDERGRTAGLKRAQGGAIAQVLSASSLSPVLSRRVIQGGAADVLVRAASAADYLVVGTGRKGTLRRALLGSVSESCVRRGRCPVVVVPPPSAKVALQPAS